MAVHKHASLLWEITCHIGSQCYLPTGRGDIPAFTPCSQLRLVLDLTTPEKCNAKLTWLDTEVVYPPKMVTNPSTNRAQRRVTFFMR